MAADPDSFMEAVKAGATAMFGAGVAWLFQSKARKQSAEDAASAKAASAEGEGYAALERLLKGFEERLGREEQRGRELQAKVDALERKNRSLVHLIETNGITVPAELR